MLSVGAAAVAAVLGAAWWVHSLGPVPRGEALDHSTLVVDREGRLLRPYATAEGRWRLPAMLDQVDQRYVEMLLAYEDRRFRSHIGVDPLAIGRAALQFITSGRIVSGGSTITMQVARLLEPRTERSFGAKLRQAVRAIQLERVLGKDEVLALYLSLGAIWWQSRRHPRRSAVLFRQGTAPAFDGGSGAARGVTAVAGSPPSGSFRCGRTRRAGSRARPDCIGRAYSR